MSERVKWLAVFAAAIIVRTLATAAPDPSAQPKPSWQTIPGGRWTPLNVPAQGKTGFTLLPPDQTGLRFTNTLDEWQGASNRVLYNGSGVAVGDFDKDGLPDIFFCSLNGRNTLFRNLGGFRFADVTEQSGLTRDRRFYRGAVFADINGDESLDLLVCVLGGGVQVWLNDGKGRFSDSTAAARTGSPFGSATLALADVDGNGSLDLYVANNRTDDMRDRGQVNLRMVDGKMVIPPELQDRLVMINGQLQEYGEPDQLFMNDGRGHFSPVSWTGGRFRNEDGLPLTQPPLDWGLAAMFRDVNGDGFPDLYVCNDFWTPDRFWLNDGKGRFQAVSRLTTRNMSASSMGVDFADIDRDGDLDFFVVDMLSREPRLRKRQKLAQTPMASPIGTIEDRPQVMRNTLFLNRGDGTFAEIANYAGVAASDWSWSPAFLDVDLDGYEDLLIAAGHMKDVQDLDALVQIRARQHSWTGFTNDAARQKAFTQELMEHMRLYPPLQMPIIAFRNRGDLHFDEMTSAWGTDQAGVHHAMAMADFDGDGDLDLVVNNLGSNAAIYRNDTAAARIAIRLHGLPANFQGIGAKVAIVQQSNSPTAQRPALPAQSAEAISGGRYMAGSEPLLVFAAGSDNMTIEVAWRSGKKSVITNALPNRLYEIEEGAASPSSSPPPVQQEPSLFEDVSHLLKHTHHEDPFDDFARQPMLPHRYSQLGPGVAWFDIDNDGRDDLIIGSGRGGQMGCYRNTGTGFERLSGSPFDKSTSHDQTTILGWNLPSTGPALLIGSASYESPTPNNTDVQWLDFKTKTLSNLTATTSPQTSIGPLALADLDADGDLDLFVGGRVVPGRYPESAASRIYRFDAGQFGIDTANTSVLTNAGMISSAVWSDLTGDGFPELILACEWGPVRIYRNSRGKLSAWNPPIHYSDTPTLHSLDDLTGWWTGVTTGDLDGDGRLDIIVANWGLNGDGTATQEHPLELYYGDLAERGANDLIEAEWSPRDKQLIPRRGLDAIGRNLPAMIERFKSHRAFSEAPLSAVLAPNEVRWRKLAATTLASTAFLNRGNRFDAFALPPEAQWAPAFAVNIADFDGDGHEDVFLSQNFFATAPDTPRLDAGRGLLLRGNGTGKLTPLSAQESGLEICGEQRGAAVADFDADGRTDLIVTQNGAPTKLFHNRRARPGLRVRLVGPPGNPHGIGAALRLISLNTNNGPPNAGPIREVHAGSGYWSQDSSVQILNANVNQPSSAEVWVRWPGGQTSTVAVPPGLTDIAITNSVTARQN